MKRKPAAWPQKPRPLTDGRSNHDRAGILRAPRLLDALAVADAAGVLTPVRAAVSNTEVKRMSTTILHQTRWFSIRRAEDGEEFLASTGERGADRALNAAGEVLLSIEPSAAFGEPTLILPGGQVEANVPNHEQANLELQEEIGFRRLDRLSGRAAAVVQVSGGAQLRLPGPRPERIQAAWRRRL